MLSEPAGGTGQPSDVYGGPPIHFVLGERSVVAAFSHLNTCLIYVLCIEIRRDSCWPIECSSDSNLMCMAFLSFTQLWLSGQSENNICNISQFFFIAASLSWSDNPSFLPHWNWNFRFYSESRESNQCRRQGGGGEESDKWRKRKLSRRYITKLLLPLVLLIYGKF